MTKIATNRRHGGFSLSEKAMERYAEIKGLNLYPDKSRYGITVYWTVPESDRTGIIPDNEFFEASQNERKKSNERQRELTICNRNFERNDPILIQVIEELGEAANGRCAALEITEIPDGVEWQIEEYDGFEHVAEKHRTW